MLKLCKIKCNSLTTNVQDTSSDSDTLDEMEKLYYWNNGMILQAQYAIYIEDGKLNETRAIYAGTFDPIPNGHVRYVSQEPRLNTLDEIVIRLQRARSKDHYFLQEIEVQMRKSIYTRYRKCQGNRGLAALLVDLAKSHLSDITLIGSKRT